LGDLLLGDLRLGDLLLGDLRLGDLLLGDLRLGDLLLGDLRLGDLLLGDLRLGDEDVDEEDEGLALGDLRLGAPPSRLDKKFSIIVYLYLYTINFFLRIDSIKENGMSAKMRIQQNTHYWI
jgi:hypothetical protein